MECLVGPLYIWLLKGQNSVGNNVFQYFQACFRLESERKGQNKDVQQRGFLNICSFRWSVNILDCLLWLERWSNCFQPKIFSKTCIRNSKILWVLAGDVWELSWFWFCSDVYFLLQTRSYNKGSKPVMNEQTHGKILKNINTKAVLLLISLLHPSQPNFLVHGHQGKVREEATLNLAMQPSSSSCLSSAFCSNPPQRGQCKKKENHRTDGPQIVPGRHQNLAVPLSSAFSLSSSWCSHLPQCG